MRYSLLAFVECTHGEQGLKPTTLTIIRVSIHTPIPSLKWDAPLLKIPRLWAPYSLIELVHPKPQITN